MTFAINKLNDIFPCTLKTITIISCIPTCYAKCHNVYNCPLKNNFAYVDEEYHIENWQCDTLRPLGI